MLATVTARVDGLALLVTKAGVFLPRSCHGKAPARLRLAACIVPCRMAQYRRAPASGSCARRDQGGVQVVQ